ncbi:MAG: D-amino acid aminotransferase [Candidatus Palauibacterales bacterium]|nr:D-amino acid aminotransferase [Candidatus Palauibacterales bacterium]
MTTVYMNGEYLPKREAAVSPDDRGFLLADGVYEVTPAYDGEFFGLDGHLERLERGLEELRIGLDVEPLAEVHRRLLEENGLAEVPTAKVYLQVTRGAARRQHAFPEAEPEPTVYAFATEWTAPDAAEWEEGCSAVTVPDRRWSRVDIKSIALLPNVLAQQAAHDAGAEESIFVHEGVAIEGAHANFWAVLDGTVVTHPATNRILPGITRATVLELARDRGHPVRERPVQVEELPGADEVFLTGTTTEVLPITELDGDPVSDGSPGPVSRDLFVAYREKVGGPVPAFPAPAGGA